MTDELTLTYTVNEAYNNGRGSKRAMYKCVLDGTNINFYKEVDGDEVPVKRSAVKDYIVDSWIDRINGYASQLNDT